MLQLYPAYLLWNRRKTLTGSPDPTRMQTVQINLAQGIGIASMGSNIYYAELFGLVRESDRDQGPLLSVVPVPFPLPPLSGHRAV